MKKKYILTAVFIILGLAFVSLTSGCFSENSSRIKVVTSTSLIAQIVKRVGGDKVDVANIIPPAQCPGHFDVKPGDIQKLAKADLFLLHGWQGEKFSQSLLDSSGNPDITIVKINVDGNWMTPPVQKQAVDKITNALIQVDTKNSSFYQKSASDYKKAIAAKEAEIRAKLAKKNLSAINVMCADMQAGFVKWAGFNIVATYDRPDSLTPQVVKELVDKGRVTKVSLIIDNIQSGKDAAAGIAEELGCVRIILSNFPGGFENTETWEQAAEKNIDLIMEALAH
jgi:zinc transport system substrate-binding protein